MREIGSTDLGSPEHPAVAHTQGCNWATFEERGDTPAAEWDAITFKHLGRLAEEHPNLCRRIPFYDLWTEKKPTPWYKGLVFNVSVSVAAERRGI